MEVAASAQEPLPGPTGITEDEARRWLAGCPESVRSRVLARDAGGGETVWTVREPWLIRSDSYWGDGEDGMTSVDHTLLHPRSCFAIVVQESFETSSPFLRTFVLEGSEEAAPPFLLESILGVEVEPYDPSALGHGAARLLMATRAATGGEPNPEYLPCQSALDSSHRGVTPTEPLAPRSEWREGAPDPTPYVYSSGTVLVSDPARARTTAWPGRWRLLSYPIASRFGAEVVAVHDTRRDRHRWVLASISCAVGRTDWLAHADGWFFGVTDAPADAAAPRIIGLDANAGEARVFVLDELSDDDGLPTVDELCSGDAAAAEGGCLDLSATARGLVVSSCATPNGSCRTRHIDFGLLRRLARHARGSSPPRQDRIP